MVVNRQRQVRIPIQTLENFLARARKALRLPSDSFTVCLVPNATIASWNRRYRGKNRPTDVLSFPTDDFHRANENIKPSRQRREFGSRIYLGDIAIAPRVALQNARRLGRSFEEELCILALHGALHLMGYDHETDSGQMERREQRLRRALKLA
jgi:probable rRNA maturation factor